MSSLVKERIRFELCRFRSPLLTTSRLISSPAPTKMFQFGAFPIVQRRLTTQDRQDVPFGDPGFKDSMHLPRAYRSLARPSSASQTEPSNDKHKFVYSPLLPCNVLSYRDRQIPIHGFHMVNNHQPFPADLHPQVHKYKTDETERFWQDNRSIPQRNEAEQSITTTLTHPLSGPVGI